MIYLQKQLQELFATIGFDKEFVNNILIEFNLDEFDDEHFRKFIIYKNDKSYMEGFDAISYIYKELLRKMQWRLINELSIESNLCRMINEALEKK